MLKKSAEYHRVCFASSLVSALPGVLVEHSIEHPGIKQGEARFSTDC
jgi:hypothetical protein